MAHLPVGNVSPAALAALARHLAGDALGAVLWGAALWFCSPVQLLLLFFGQFEAERPSDWLQRRLGAAAGLPVGALDYITPLAVRLGAAAVCAAGGAGVSAALNLGLGGDATW
jgi:hypothetical protein